MYGLERANPLGLRHVSYPEYQEQLRQKGELRASLLSVPEFQLTDRSVHTFAHGPLRFVPMAMRQALVAMLLLNRMGSSRLVCL